MKCIIVLFLLSMSLHAQIVDTYPSYGFSIDNQNYLNIRKGENLCGAPVGTATSFLQEEGSPVAGFKVPNTFLCTSGSVVTSVYLGPNNEWLKSNGVKFGEYWNDYSTAEEPFKRFRPIDLDHNGLGRYWIVEMTRGEVIELKWDWATLAPVEVARIGGLTQPTSIAIEFDQMNNRYLLYVLERANGVIKVFDSETGSLIKSEKIIIPDRFNKIPRLTNTLTSDGFKQIASSWNPYTHVKSNYLFILDNYQIYYLNKSSFEIEKVISTGFPYRSHENLAVASNGELLGSDNGTGEIYSYDLITGEVNWNTKGHKSSYIDGEISMFFRPWSIEPYFDYLIVGEPVFKDYPGVGTRAVKYHENVPMTPKVVELIDDCKGGKSISVTHINPNPGRIYTPAEKSYLIVDGVRTDLKWSWKPSNGENSTRLIMPFREKFEWFFDGNYLTSEGIEPSNACPVETVIPKLIQVEKFCDGYYYAQPYYKVHIGYDNPNDFEIPIIDNYATKMVGFYPNDEFGFYENHSSPKILYPGYHTSQDGDDKVKPIIVQIDGMTDEKNINFFSWSIFSRVTSRFPEKEFVNTCGVLDSPIKVKVMDNAFQENNITKPVIGVEITDLISNYDNISLRYWFDISEYPTQNVVADLYWTKHQGTTIQVKDNYVEIKLPSTLELNHYNPIKMNNIQFGIHFENYHPGVWNKINDWSYQGVSTTTIETSNITVYSNKELIYGKEPSYMPVEPSSSSEASSSSSSEVNCNGGIVGSESCPIQIFPDEGYEIEVLKENDVFVFSPEVWPGANNRWWDPNIVLYLDKVGNSKIPELIVQDKYNEFETGGSWFHTVNISDEYPYLIRFIAKESGKFKVRLSTF